MSTRQRDGSWKIPESEARKLLTECIDYRKLIKDCLKPRETVVIESSKILKKKKKGWF